VDYDAVVAAIRAAVPGVVAVYLFGSFARGDATPESDVDLAFLASTSLRSEARWNLQEELAEMLRKPVDLVELRSASTVMRTQVLSSGRVLYESDATTRSLFEASALGAYARLNEERRGILDDIHERGSVHGDPHG